MTNKIALLALLLCACEDDCPAGTKFVEVKNSCSMYLQSAGNNTYVPVTYCKYMCVPEKMLETK